MNKEKKINLFFLILIFIVFFACLVLIGISRNTELNSIVLVKDITNDSNRIISDKTDILKQTDDSYIIKVEEPDDLLNPNDIFKDVSNSEIIGSNPSKDDRRVTTSTGDLVTEPLKLYDVDSVIDILQTEIIEDTTVKDTLNKELDKLLNDARLKRNNGRIETSTGLNFFDFNKQYVTMRDINTKGLVVVFFSSDNSDSYNYIKNFEKLYEKYKNDISFMFINNSFEGYDKYLSILETFKEYEISSELPIYFDYYSQFFAASNLSSITFGYALVNTDCFIYEMKNKSDSISDFGESIKQMQLEQEEFKKQDAEITLNWQNENLT